MKAALPATFKPQLATLVDTAPPGDDWSYEIKFDGYRVLMRIDRHAAKNAGAGLHARRQRLDREVQQAGRRRSSNSISTAHGSTAKRWCSIDNGVPNFQALQNAFDANRPQDIVIYLFDVPFLNGYDLRGVPLVQRRAILRALLEGGRRPRSLRFSERLRVQRRRSAEERLRHGARRHHRQAARQPLHVGRAPRRGSSSSAGGARNS